jgi:hypothetical protein
MPLAYTRERGGKKRRGGPGRDLRGGLDGVNGWKSFNLITQKA